MEVRNTLRHQDGEFMTTETDPPRQRTRDVSAPRFRPRTLALAGMLALGLLSTGAWAWWNRATDPRQRPDVHLVDVPVFEARSVMAAEATWVDDEALVLGLSAGGRHRAYLLNAFAAVERHVANDRLGDVAVAVCYCDRTDMARAFTAAGDGGPLAVACGGFQGRYDWGSLLLRIDRWHYRLDDGRALETDAPAFPYAAQDLTRTTWRAWRDTHPDTDIFVGDDQAVGFRDLPAVPAGRAVAAGAANLQDDAEVLGVSAAGRHRAYPLRNFRDIDHHVLNDLVGRVPVTVSFCGIRECARVFTAAPDAGLLDVAYGGFSGSYDTGAFLLRVGRWHYHLDTGRPVEDDAPPFPYGRAAFERTTWKAWREAHPDTDVSTEPPVTGPGETRL